MVVWAAPLAHDSPAQTRRAHTSRTGRIVTPSAIRRPPEGGHDVWFSGTLRSFRCAGADPGPASRRRPTMRRRLLSLALLATLGIAIWTVGGQAQNKSQDWP